MAAVLEPKDAKDTAAKHGSQVDEQLAQATSRIRTHDLLFGGLVLLGLVLAYTAAMIVLDKSFNLPQWVRQVSLLGFVGAFAATAYFTIVSPLRKKINPLYAAKQVESTIEDAKNSVTGYVDAQQKGTLNATVKAALASRAAKSVAGADVNKAVDHRSLVYLGGVAVVLFLTLVVLFFVFRPAQFGSLVGRTFAPFTSGDIKTQTQIELQKPNPPEPAITDGQTVTVAVHIGGKVPRTDAPDRVRLMVRHNPADPNFTEVTMPPGDTSRDFEVRVPNHLVQNGFWYKVAAGDAETPEYKVTVRSLPLFTRFQATYEPPKYLRRKIGIVDSPIIQGYRGTTVLLTAGTNREARGGVMVIEPGGATVASTPFTDDPKAMHFRFTLKESGRYKLTYTTLDGEKSAEPFQSTITVLTDAAPTLVIDKPEEEEVVIPANGQLAIDGKVGDDFGIDTITLKMRLTGAAARDLPDRPFLYGKSTSFKREKDGTWPTNVDYKDSVDFAQLKKDAAGLDFELKPDMVIEYWLEAADNCTEPKPNVGKSAVKSVRLAPPIAEEPKKDELNQQKNDRKAEEKKHNDKQQQKLDQEKRDQPKNDQNPQAQPPEGAPKQDNKNEGDRKKDGNDPMGGNQPKKDDPQEGGPKKDGMTGGGMGGMTDPANPPKPTNDKGDNPPKQPNDPSMPLDPNNMGMGGMNQPPTAPMPKNQDEKDVQKKADELNRAIEQENKNGGSAKPNEAPSEQERTSPAEQKPQPPMGDAGGMPESKPEPKGGDPMGMGQKPESTPAAGKPEGQLEKPADPSAPKPEAPKQNNNKGMGEKNAPAEKRDEPIGAPPGTEKPQPEKAQPEPKDPNKKQDPNSGSTAKPCDNPSAAGGGQPQQGEKRDPAADAGSKAKPMPEPNRGADKPSEPKGKPPEKPEGTKPEGAKPEGQPEAGNAKPEKAPPAAGSKPMPPKEDMMPGGRKGEPEAKPDAGANEPKKENGTGAAETKPAKPDDPKQPMTGAAGTEKGEEKPAKPDPKPGTGAGAPKDKKLSEQEMKELEEAAKNLTSPDEKKKQDARDKLDKAVGQEKRQELEKLANDLQSPDEKTRKDAERKLEEMKQQAQKGGAGAQGEKNGEAPKLDEKQKQEIADAVKDLQSDDKGKKEAAQRKLDKMVGEQARKEAEQLMNDLKSDDKQKRDAAEKKLDDLKKEMEKQAASENAKKDDRASKGKEPSKEEIESLAKQAEDLQSKDPKTRERAEKELDKKLGKENREKLQEQLKNQKPGDAEQEKKLKEEIEKQAKERAKKEHDPKGGGLGTGAQTKEAMEEDARNRLKTAELQLEQFEKKRYDEAFKRKQGFTDAEYEKFLRDYERYVEKMREDTKKGVASGDKAPPAGTPESGGPITAGGAGKVEGRPNTTSATGTGTTLEAPGFENLKDKFQKLINEKK